MQNNEKGRPRDFLFEAYVLVQESANFFCKKLDSKYLGFACGHTPIKVYLQT